MVVFPNCKINLGLNILDKREDGFHNLQSVFIPVQLCDALEIIESEKDELFIYGKKVIGELEKNSCFKALQILRGVRKFSPVHIHLLKNIPMGAGLGGGSSDGAYTLKLLNEKFNLGFSENELAQFAIQIGSDCAFFIYNKPIFIEGRGEKISPINFLLKDYEIAIVFPEVHIDTALAFEQLAKSRSKNNITTTLFSKTKFLQSKPEDWKNMLVNDFENVVFPIHSVIEKWKRYFYEQGAVFSLMSGSGSCIYALFKKSDILDKLKAGILRNNKIFIKELRFEDERNINIDV
ncbi:4-diphosphocytidyl-2-C-methyl-D-erythritol kinase [Bacteroidota bacterium]|nr:4-diphosphocytidyl-2-C-methyl-D-erythritol kinase [Bacteroidota bacterium]